MVECYAMWHVENILFNVWNCFFVFVLISISKSKIPKNAIWNLTFVYAPLIGICERRTANGEHWTNTHHKYITKYKHTKEVSPEQCAINSIWFCFSFFLGRLVFFFFFLSDTQHQKAISKILFTMNAQHVHFALSLLKRSNIAFDTMSQRIQTEFRMRNKNENAAKITIEIPFFSRFRLSFSSRYFPQSQNNQIRKIFMCKWHSIDIA